MEAIPIIIDVEASGFGKGSYPIEVGFVLPDETTHCFLVRPEPDWLVWDSKAAELHRIPREILFKRGVSVNELATYLNDKLAGKTVYTDGWSFDMSWIGLLFDCAGKTQLFRLEHLRKLITDNQAGIWDSTREAIMEELNMQRHRASMDAKVLQLTYLRTQALAALETTDINTKKV